MAENLEFTQSQSEDIPKQEVITAQELLEVIEEIEQYRERLVNETISAAQKAKLSQKTALAKIEPELAQIDAALQNLRTQQAALVHNN
ncbi:hypothetical protein [Aphanothece sacrum]|uniref:Peptide ABC transporter substrate-binding protein n=1 Tax=Aphanothece sacrum FPU1 TaxID=1920663 RepID=A0A401IL10_APHSA|nr:hypothetical protein [Aphanothece sacrum]GBF81925.1 peptide ABC transporter substrate-binding protein [Aphanothece sacrum FPU1]GBF83555.1 peptide ABC transporter substrate-binding protein [Aphanothece sacrum FPU3]